MEKKNNYEIIEFIDNDFTLNVNLDLIEKTVWLSQQQIAMLFETSKQNVSFHINNILKTNKFDYNSVVKYNFTTATDGKTYRIKIYNLNIIVSIGYIMKSNRVFLFKQWADSIFENKTQENSTNHYEIVKFVNNKVELEVNIDPDFDTVWLTHEQLSILFNTTKQNISFHVNNILNEGELEVATVKDYLTVRFEGNRKVTRKIKSYNLDMIISVGFRVNSKQGILFRKWANKVLKEYLLKGYVINQNRTNVSNENYRNLVDIVLDIKSSEIITNNRLNKLEDKVFDKQYGLDKIFFNGEFFDAYSLIQQIFESANDQIIVIDNYIDRSLLDRLVVKKNSVKITIYTNINTSKLLNNDIKIFNKQYGLLDIKYTTKVHDRYIIIDNNKLYHLGHSIKVLGKKIFSISESDGNLIVELINNI